MAIEVRREKKGVTSADRFLPEWGRVSWESARRGELNGIGLEASLFQYHLVANNLKVLSRETKVQKNGEPFNQWSDSFGTECVGFRSARGIEWYLFRSICMAIHWQVIREKRADTLAGRYPPESR